MMAKVEEEVSIGVLPSRQSRLVALNGFLGLGSTLFILIVIFSLLNPRFASTENLRNILEQSSIPLILGVGATLVILLGSIDLSIQGVMATSAMIFVLLSANSRGSKDFGLLAVVAAIAGSLLLGAISGLILTRLKVPSFVVTLGMWYVGLGVATLLYGSEVLPAFSDPKVSGWSSRLVFGAPNSFWAAAIIVLLGAGLLGFTTLGRATLAIGMNENVAANSGLNVNLIKVIIFAIAGGLAGVAGIIAAIRLGSGSPAAGNGTLFITIPAVVIGGTSLGGGTGGIARTVFGVFILTILNNGLTLAGVSPNFQAGVAGLILIVAVVVSLSSQRDFRKLVKR
jgi:ribose transport system permease protein